MNDDEKVKAVQSIHAHVRDWRGRLLNSAAVNERQIAQIITWYFCDERRRDFFFSEIATSYFFSLRAKIDILSKILKTDYEFFLDEQPDFLKDVNEMKYFRNLLAHATLDLSDKALSRDPRKGVGFLQFHDGKREVKVVTEEDFNNWNATCGMVSSFLSTFEQNVRVPELFQSRD